VGRLSPWRRPAACRIGTVPGERDVEGTPIEKLESAGLTLSSRIWNLISVAKLNAAFTLEMVHGTDENWGALVSVVASLKEVSEHITRIVADANASEAAIASARAGVHGRGFKVVADEVKKLAARSNEFTRIVNESLETLHVSVSETVRSIDGFEQVRERMTEGIGQARADVERSAESIRSIEARTQGVAKAVRAQQRQITSIDS
jgi:methyl-accepting chemotaxis protein